MEFQPMSPEEIQRTVQFLLHQQAQFAADFAASQARFDVRLEKVADGLIGLTAIVGRVVDQFAEGQQRANERMDVLSGHIKTVIQMFERHLRDDHGHRPS